MTGRILHKLFVLTLTFLIALSVWQCLVWIIQPKPWLLPSPVHVATRFLELIRAGSLQRHTFVTLIEVTSGFALGTATGLFTGYPISQIKLLERWATPYLIAANSIPIVAFAPLLMLWLGTGIQTKITVAALIVYFPVTMSTMVGFKQVSSIHRRLMASLHANKWQLFKMVEVPTAIPGIFAGMKIASPLAVVGAVVGEFMGSGEGLGHLIMEANGLLDTSMLFVSIIVLSAMGIAFYSIVAGAEALLIGPWHHERRRRK
ncbi:MAG: ABC transporter permease [Acidobacteria bacterium]|nr:ABC transporter permease [Acidobacteriota bacterium]